MRYYISDLHFYHESLLTKMDKRGFSSCEEMHDYMVEKWNKKVRANDEVIILGDVSMGRGKPTSDMLARLNGRLSLIVGNHDTYLKDRRFDASRFEWIKPYEELSDNKRKVILSHYPIFCYNGQYRRDKEGMPKTYMLYGHVHDTQDEVLVNRFIQETRQACYLSPGDGEPRPIPCQMINCFCMFSDYTPLTLDEWIVVDGERREGIAINGE
ncbi:MAG: metallophosphoesterase family protein [Lachnospiraceae bacterium]|nr:metallophosphoesterase family protein [Lachnospiraceae bacterium]